MSKGTKLALLAFLVFLMAAIPLAMMPPNTGAMEGVVSDELGPVPGAAIEAHQQVTSVFEHADADANGYYRLDMLRAGHYSLWVESPGHDSIYIAQVSVERGRVARQDILMRRTRMVTPTGE